MPYIAKVACVAEVDEVDEVLKNFRIFISKFLFLSPRAVVGISYCTEIRKLKIMRWVSWGKIWCIYKPTLLRFPVLRLCPPPRPSESLI